MARELNGTFRAAAGIEKGPAIKGSDAGPENAHAGEAGTGTRSGRKAGDVHRPLNVTALEFVSSIIG
jgi:hypothetical protein